MPEMLDQDMVTIHRRLSRMEGDITEIKNAIAGNKISGAPGMAQRLDKVEGKVEGWESKIQLGRGFIIGIGFFSGAVSTILITVLTKYL